MTARANSVDGIRLATLDGQPVDAEDLFGVQLADGNYDVVFVRHRQIKIFKRDVWEIVWALAGEEQIGLRIGSWWNFVPHGARTPSPSFTLSAAYVIATGRRPPRNFARLKPGGFLAGAIFEARIAKTKRDRFGTELPEGAGYSAVRSLVRRIQPNHHRKGGR